MLSRSYSLDDWRRGSAVPDSASRIVAITAGTNPITGVSSS